MATWIIAIAAVLICGVMLAVCLSLTQGQRRDIEHQKQQAERIEALEAEVERLRVDDRHLRMDNDALSRSNRRLRDSFRAELAHGKDCEAQIAHTVKELHRLQDGISANEAIRIRTERELGAMRMRCEVYEKENDQLRAQIRAQEKLYQSIILEHEDTIASLQSRQQKQSNRKPKPVKDQVTLDDLLGAM